MFDWENKTRRREALEEILLLLDRTSGNYVIGWRRYGLGMGIFKPMRKDLEHLKPLESPTLA
jgi:hypothetical protein